MHGSPLSKFDNRAIWDKYDYRNLCITAEPYFDLDFNRFYYLTDTGRRWDGDSFSVRDKPFLRTPLTNTVFQRQHYHSTEEIIGAIISGTFPDHAMMTFHPQRWTDNVITWSKEYLLQNIKNIIKKQFFVK
jgi:hypothetical protein